MEQQQLKDYLMQVNEVLLSVKEMNTRIDERIKIVVDKIVAQDDRLDRMDVALMETSERVTTLEAKNLDQMRASVHDLRNSVHKVEVKLTALEIYSQRHDTKWASVADFMVKALWAVAACVVIYRVLGLNALPLP